MWRMWVEMPAVSGAPTASAVRPKYPLDVSAIVVYRGPKAYIAVEDEVAQQAATRYPDVHLLTPSEGRALEESLSLPPLGERYDSSGTRRLGDVLHRVITAAGVADCDGCRKRRQGLNRVIVWGWWRNPSRP